MEIQANPKEVAYAPVFNDVWDKSGVGIAILNNQLRYEAVNLRLAQMHGIAPEKHIGKSLNEIIGNIASQVEDAIRRAFSSGQPVLNIQCAGTFPMAPDTSLRKRWVVNYFPARDQSGSVKHVGAIVVEVEPQEQNLSTEIVGAGKDVSMSEVLRSWKGIANYMQTCVKTVQRWERLYGLPVRRLAATKGSVVYAVRSDIDGWMRTRSQDGSHRWHSQS